MGREIWHLAHPSFSRGTGIILPRLEKVPLLPENVVIEARQSVELMRKLEKDMGDVERRIYGNQKNMVRL